MKSYIFLGLLSYLSFTNFCMAQKKGITNDCGDKKSDRYTLTHSDSINKFTPALYPGGEEELKKYLNDALINHKITNSNESNRTLFIRITIMENGEVKEPTILKYIFNCLQCDSIAMNIVNKMPKWIPAKGLYKDGSLRNEKDQVILPLKF